LNTQINSHNEELATSISSNPNDTVGESIHDDVNQLFSGMPLSQRQNLHSNSYVQAHMSLGRETNSNLNSIMKPIHDSTLFSDFLITHENSRQGVKSNMEMIDRLKRVIHIQENQIACLEKKVVKLAKDSQYIEDKYVEVNDKKEELALLCKHLELKFVKLSQEKQDLEGDIEQIEDFKASLEGEKDNIITDCAFQLSAEKERNQHAEGELWSQNEALQKEINTFKEKIEHVSNLESNLKILEDKNEQLEEESKAKDKFISDLNYELKEMGKKVEGYEEILTASETTSKELEKKDKECNTLKDKLAHTKIELDTAISKLMLEEEKLEFEFK